MNRSQLLFVEMWTAASVDGGLSKTALAEWDAAKSVGPGAPRLPVDYWSNCSWLRWESFARGGGEYVLTPIGEDVVATARLVDLHAKPAAPVKVCSTCGGTREICIIGAFSVPCKACTIESDLFGKTIVFEKPVAVEPDCGDGYLFDIPGSLGGGGQ